MFLRKDFTLLGIEQIFFRTVVAMIPNLILTSKISGVITSITYGKGTKTVPAVGKMMCIVFSLWQI